MTGRFKGFSGPVGSGKSTALAQEALRLAVRNPGLLGLIGAPTYPMLRDVTQRTFLEILEENDIDYVFHKHENHFLLFPWNSEVIFRSLDHPDRLRGTNLAWFGIDEMTYCQESAFLRLQARLRHPRAAELCGFGVWTPQGYDWVYRRFVESTPVDYGLVLASPGENRYLPGDFYEQLKSSYAERFYKQEVMGEYLDVFGGNTYYAFSDQTVRPLAYNPGLPLCWALDFNVDPLCSVIFQIQEIETQPTGRRVARIYVLDEIVLPNSNTVEATREFIRRTLSWHDLVNVYNPPDWDGNCIVAPMHVTIYGDASGNSRTTKSTRTDYELIREVFRQYPQWQIALKTNTSNPAIKDRVNAVNALLCNVSGKRRLFVDPKCRELIRDFKQVKWNRDSAGNPTGDLDKSDWQRTHTSDALSYCIAKEFGLRPRFGEMSYPIL